MSIWLCNSLHEYLDISFTPWTFIFSYRAKAPQMSQLQQWPITALRVIALSLQRPHLNGTPLFPTRQTPPMPKLLKPQEYHLTPPPTLQIMSLHHRGPQCPLGLLKTLEPQHPPHRNPQGLPAKILPQSHLQRQKEDLLLCLGSAVSCWCLLSLFWSAVLWNECMKV